MTTLLRNLLLSVVAIGKNNESADDDNSASSVKSQSQPTSSKDNNPNDDDDDDKKPSSSNKDDGDDKNRRRDQRQRERLPILIIPGFMSSGLEIVESKVEPTWVGDRLWLNLKRLGIASAEEGSSSVMNRNKINNNNNNNNGTTTTETAAAATTTTTKKASWIRHMMLQPVNRIHEVDGIKVRAIPGLLGVEYLDDTNSFSKYVSYVFGPLIKVLKHRGGYQQGIDLDAAPYDWRLLPSELEKRDGYFSNLIQTVERLYYQNNNNNNNNTPIVLLCHSMGCKVGHYFLNFCLRTKGQAWIDRYIHTFMVVGAPHLGAANTIRGLVCGDKMGLDAFLSNRDAIRLARSWGSVFWLMPKELPMGIPRCSYLRPTGRLSIRPIIWPTLDPIVTTFLNYRHHHHYPEGIKLCIIFGGHVLIKSFRSLQNNNNNNNGKEVEESDAFTFSTDPDGPTIDGRERFFQLMFLSSTNNNNNNNNNNHPPPPPHQQQHEYAAAPESCFLRVATCPLKTAARCFRPCENWFSRHFPSQYHVTKQLVAQAIDQSAIIATCGPIHLNSIFPPDDATTTSKRSVQKRFTMRYAPFHSWGKPKLQEIDMEIQWHPFSLDDDDVEPPPRVAEVYRDSKAAENEEFCAEPYRPVHPYQLSKIEGGSKSAKAVINLLDDDPIDPRGSSSWEAPPARRVKAIYGINLPTEVGAVYRARPAKMMNGTTTTTTTTMEDTADSNNNSSNNKSAYVLDENAEISSFAKQNGYRIRGGILEETTDTRYTSLPATTTTTTTSGGRSQDVRKCSGDGTVPYWSLRHAKTWQSDNCQVEVNEIERVDHREILADERFHKLVLDYCLSTSS